MDGEAAWVAASESGNERVNLTVEVWTTQIKLRDQLRLWEILPRSAFALTRFAQGFGYLCRAAEPALSLSKGSG